MHKCKIFIENIQYEILKSGVENGVLHLSQVFLNLNQGSNFIMVEEQEKNYCKSTCELTNFLPLVSISILRWWEGAVIGKWR